MPNVNPLIALGTAQKTQTNVLRNLSQWGTSLNIKAEENKRAVDKYLTDIKAAKEKGTLQGAGVGQGLSFLAAFAVGLATGNPSAGFKTYKYLSPVLTAVGAKQGGERSIFGVEPATKAYATKRKEILKGAESGILGTALDYGFTTAKFTGMADDLSDDLSKILQDLGEVDTEDDIYLDMLDTSKTSSTSGSWGGSRQYWDKFLNYKGE